METTQNKYKIGQIRTDNRAKIIAIAEMEFAEFGYKGASIMNIAKRANMPRANVHYYFQNKLELYKKVLTDILQLWNQAFNQITPEDDPADALGAYIKAKVMYSKTNPLASKIFANEIIHGAPRINEYLNSDFREWLRSKSAVIEQWIKQGKMDPVDPLFLIMLIWSATQHYADFSTQVNAVLDKKELTDRDFEDIANNLTHIILKGCGIQIKSPLIT
jgi:TetR/AcrR family transcriptional regulator